MASIITPKFPMRSPPYQSMRGPTRMMDCGVEILAIG